MRRDVEEQANAIEDFIYEYDIDEQLSQDNIIFRKYRNGRSEEEIVSLIIKDPLLRKSAKEDMDYTIVYIPKSDNEALIGYLEQEKEYIVWKITHDDGILETTEIELSELLKGELK